MFHNAKPSVLAVAIVTCLATFTALSPAAAAGSTSSVSAVAMASSDSGPTFAHRGSLVHASQLTIRTFVNAKDGFSLASVGGAQYPANTTDGGKTWRIDGPHFHVNAANAPDAITRTGAAGTDTYFAYAGPGGGQSIVVSTDAGKHWWRAYMPGVPLTVEPTYSSGKQPALVTIVETNPGQFAAYITTDGGRHWRLHHGYV